MNLGPTLVTSNIHSTLEVCVWKNPKGWTQEEVNICTKYYQLQAKKMGMSISRYMSEFQWN